MRSAFFAATLVASSYAINTVDLENDLANVIDTLSQDQVFQWGEQIFNDGADVFAQVDPELVDSAWGTLAQVGEIGMNLYAELDSQDTDKVFNGLAQVGNAGLEWVSNVDDDSKNQVSNMLAQAISTTGFTPDYAMEMAQSMAENFDIADIFAQVDAENDEEYY